MCWFSVENSSKAAAQAEIGESLAIRLTLHACSRRRAANWIVPAHQLNWPDPCPVCLPDGATVVFTELPEAFRNRFQLPGGVSARFAMERRHGQKVDVFQFEQGPELRLDQLTHGLRFTVASLPAANPLTDAEWTAVERIFSATSTPV